jgi:hypothetical protein
VPLAPRDVLDPEDAHLELGLNVAGVVRRAARTGRHGTEAAVLEFTPLVECEQNTS